MKKILGIIGSPRKLGNCEIIIKEIFRHVEVPAQLQLLRLSDFDVKPCKGCYSCLAGDGHCVLDDDFSVVLSAMAAADAYIVAVPAYVLGANSSLKRLQDRGLGFYASGEKVWNKPAIGLSLAGMEGKEGSTKLSVDSFLHFLMADVYASQVMYAALPAEVVGNNGNMASAKKLGKALFGKSSIKRENRPTCPVCGSDTFRFLDYDTVRCMVCSNSGKWDVSSGKPAFLITRSSHELLADQETAWAHHKWLQDMKERYKKDRLTLKKVALTYLKEGEWIKPVKKSAPENE